MTPTTVPAVDANGVLRPAAPLPLENGAAVSPARPAPPPGLTYVEALRRIDEAKTPEELFAASAVAELFEPEPEEDFLENLDRYRRETGQRPLFPKPGDEDYEG